MSPQIALSIREGSGKDLKRLLAPLERGLEAVRKEEIRILDDSLPMDSDEVRLLASRGKRLRAVLCLSGSGLVRRGAPGEPGGGVKIRKDPDMSEIILAAFFEATHLASLIHDDVLDSADVRRGLPTISSVFGNHAAVLIGDLIYSEINTRMLKSFPGRINLAFAEGTRAMVEGETLETLVFGKGSPSAEKCLEFIMKKTAVFFGAAASSGGLLAGADEAAATKLDLFGRNFGMAFQLSDDLLDLAGDPGLMGKETNLDIRGGKITYPLAIFMERTRNAGEILSRTRGGEKGLLYAAMKKSGAIDDVREKIAHYASAARECLDDFPPSAYGSLLVELTDFVVKRDS